MATITRFKHATLFVFTLLTFATMPARASLFTLATSGTISFNTSGDTTIPVGTPWSFELTYDTVAPDLDPDPTSGRFTNTASPPAMTFFHYRAGTYEVTMDNPADFGVFSAILTTFTTSIDGIDVNIFAPGFFPPLAGGSVSFHADFARFSPPRIFSSDALPTNTALGPGSFGDSNVTLLPPNSVVTSSNLTSLTLSLSGDINIDGNVDAADYVYWRKNFSADQAKYKAWRANFGASLGVGSGTAIPSAAPLSAGVPEPTTLALLIVGILAMCSRRRVIIS
jgi:hypothetical protein